MTRTAFTTRTRESTSRRLFSLAVAFGLTLAVLGTALAFGALAAQAQDTPAPDETTSPTFHPTFALLDADGGNVLDTGGAVSTMKTCGSCHDTEFIATHSGHADAGLSAFATPADGWASSSGLFGGWDPISYRYLSPEADASADDLRIDLTIASWIQTYGWRHVGGGPAQTAPSGDALINLPADASALAAQVVDPQTGNLVAWDWEASGTVEMNCFLCHTAAPDNASRISALEAGEFGWASTATLIGSGIVAPSDDGWTWNASAFNADGTVREDMIRVQDPSNSNCGQCHGLVHDDAQDPLVFSTGDPTLWTTLTTGQVFSPQRLSRTGLNILDKPELSRTWDVHAERAVGCTDCHYALNNPVFHAESEATRPDHLEFDPRRMDFGDYLYRPLHQFANANAETITRFGGADRDCATCHDAVSTHTWLPYADRHTSALACETCHVPTVYGPTLESVDWTVLTPQSTARSTYRGLQSDESGTLLTGFEPVVLPSSAETGARLAPYNLVSVWYWVYGEPARPVPLRDLEAVWLTDGAYPDDILAAFDADTSGTLDDAELRLDSDAKIDLIAQRLEARGLAGAHIAAETVPYAIHHNIAQGEWATKDCDTCHTGDSKLSTAFTLASFTPGGVEPTLVSDDAALNGALTRNDDGMLLYTPNHTLAPTELYVLGHDAVWWVDLIGTLAFLGVLGGVVLHGGLRYFAARRGAKHQPAARKKLYLYSIYERQWHWLQTAAIFGLIFTGLVIHRPDTFGMFSFNGVVLVHNALAIVLVVNAALSAFYHLVSGEIRQFLPRPYGFFDQAFSQAKYYLYGIFKGEPHPFEKTHERKMNPLQQITYMAILNILLPAQIITGALMWGAQQFPDVTAALGGLPFLAPFHTLIAWLFATFIIMHVYLTTTGTTPTSNIEAMITGWDEVEVPLSEGEPMTTHQPEPSSGRPAPAHSADLGSAQQSTRTSTVE
ncbi:MAG: cytochrome b/b6 domain-containing protein [Chloroflexi bacterium]|nr:cytochrome b/b6 domain-containing protein [Chloroflexota bacterium]